MAQRAAVPLAEALHVMGCAAAFSRRAMLCQGHVMHGKIVKVTLQQILHQQQNKCTKRSSCALQPGSTYWSAPTPCAASAQHCIKCCGVTDGHPSSMASNATRARLLLMCCSPASDAQVGGGDQIYNDIVWQAPALQVCKCACLQAA